MDKAVRVIFDLSEDEAQALAWVLERTGLHDRTEVSAVKAVSNALEQARGGELRVEYQNPHGDARLVREAKRSAA